MLQSATVKGMAGWRFLSNHGRALLCIAHDPGARLRDVAARLEITDRRAHGIITDLVDSGYVIKTRDGRRNQYQVRVDLPLPDPPPTGRKIGEVLELLAWTTPPPTDPPVRDQADQDPFRAETTT